MNSFNTNKPAMLFDSDVNAFWFFKNIDESTKFPMIDSLLRIPPLIELLEKSRWITHPLIEPTAVKNVLVYMNDILNREETDEWVREAVYSLREYYEEDSLFFIPNLKELDKEIRVRIINNNYIIDKDIKKYALEKIGQKINGDIEQMNQRFDILLKPIFEKLLVDKTFKFREHQKYALLWIFDNIINGSVQLVDLNMAELLIFHKTRSGKSIMMASIIALLYAMNKKPYFNVFLTGFRPDVFHSPVEALDIFNFKKNIISLKGVDVDDIYFIEDGINMVVSSFQYLYGKPREPDKPNFLLVQKVTFDLLVVDEAHDAREAERTDEEMRKIRHKMEICMTATPNKARLLNMPQTVFTYREEQTLKVLGHPAYKDTPTRKTWDLSIYDDILPAVRAGGYDDIDDFIFNYGNELAGDRKHNDSKLIKRIVTAIVYGIYNTSLPEDSWKMKFKQLKLTGRKWLKNLNEHTLKSTSVVGWLECLQKLSPSDMKDVWDTIIVTENIGALMTLQKILEDDENISKLFDIYSEHSKMPDSERIFTKGLENLTRERGKKPRIIILCGVGLQGSTFKSMQNVIHLHEINSDARYKQAVERPSTAVVGKSVYNILDFNPLKLLGFDPTMKRVGRGGSPGDPKWMALFSDSETLLTDEEIQRRLAERYDDVYDLQKIKIVEDESNILVDVNEELTIEELLAKLPTSNDHDLKLNN